MRGGRGETRPPTKGGGSGDSRLGSTSAASVRRLYDLLTSLRSLSPGVKHPVTDDGLPLRHRRCAGPGGASAGREHLFEHSCRSASAAARSTKIVFSESPSSQKAPLPFGLRVLCRPYPDAAALRPGRQKVSPSSDSGVKYAYLLQVDGPAAIDHRVSGPVRACKN